MTGRSLLALSYHAHRRDPANTWDPFDKLTDVKLNGTLVYHFIYDAFGHRVNRCTNAGCSAGEREINDGSQFVLARNGSNVITDAYGYYPGGDQPMSLQLPSGRTGVFITDPQLRGTVRAIMDADKNATNPEFKTYAVSPWGEVAADTGSITRLRMAGQQYDQGSELYYMRARYYDPQLGRFLSEDPIGISGGLNLYAYAGNDPVNLWDPSGTSGMGPGPSCVRGPVCELPDITVSSQPEPPSDIVTLEPGLPWSPKVYPGTTGSSKGGGPGGAGTQTVGRDQRPPCTLELVLLLANGASDLSTIVGVGLGAKLLAQGGAHVLFGGALESGLALNGGINGIRTAGARYMSGQWLGRFSREGAEVAIAQGQVELLRGSLATGVGVAAQAEPASSPAMLDDGGHFDWKLLIPGVGTYRAWKTYNSCRGGN